MQQPTPPPTVRGLEPQIENLLVYWVGLSDLGKKEFRMAS